MKKSVFFFNQFQFGNSLEYVYARIQPFKRHTRRMEDRHDPKWFCSKCNVRIWNVNLEFWMSTGPRKHDEFSIGNDGCLSFLILLWSVFWDYGFNAFKEHFDQPHDSVSNKFVFEENEKWSILMLNWSKHTSLFIIIIIASR